MPTVKWSNVNDPTSWSVDEVELKPHQLGWLRRPELDEGKKEVWEQPDGTLFAHQKGRPALKIVKLSCPKNPLA